ncbi:carboxypeptidase regulatory-like domain-containing protein [Corallococcus sp. Z5C101001]|uniref:carboxypeptidase regulatory-like domain-containing protein n=1 Tax=Corallococcus sp. Z5C101001 TaxID=2596829 RepID=UPI00118115F2|nr:carboxypeptidase regulatory-like domain-containing protein [Corallococcus sp. Z5C101001]TSC22974.1 DUF4139 domain-containing protein [Corallococcus sp. Z5C101001]
MVLMGLGLFLAGTLAVAIEVPDTTVTLYKDKTLVVRTATVKVAGTEQVQWPLLTGQVDPASIQVEAEGAEVQRVEVRPTYVPAFTAEEVHSALQRLGPPRPPSESLSYSRSQSDAFTELSIMAERGSPPAVDVMATLKGEGLAKVVLRYVLSGARGRYRVELTVRSQPPQVEATFLGHILQRTGVDWKDVILHFDLSRKMPPFEATGPLPERINRPDMLEEETALRRLIFNNIGQPTTANWNARASRQRDIPVVLIGTVVDVNTGAPLKDAVVTVATNRLQSRVYAFTNAHGEYRITDLPPDPAGYRLVFEHPRARTRVHEAVPAPNGGSLRFDERLWTGAGPDPDPPEPPVEGGCYLGGSVDPVIIDYLVAGLGPRESELIAPPQDFARPAGPPHGVWKSPDRRFTAPGRHIVLDNTAPRIPLLTETWPVTLHRQVFLEKDAATYLVGEVHPSAEVALLMHHWIQPVVDGKQQKFLKLWPRPPDNTFTLPLGTDPKVRAVRRVQRGPVEWNAREVQDVTVRVPNPYAEPMRVRVVDTLPRGARLIRITPGAHRDDETATLTWDLLVPPASTGAVSFRYSR